MRKTKTSYAKSRLRQLLWFFVQKYQPNCCICGKPFTEDDLPTRGIDLLTEHHLNGIHEDDRLENRALAHRRCHKSHHTKDNIGFWGQFKQMEV